MPDVTCARMCRRLRSMASRSRFLASEEITYTILAPQ